MAGENTMDGGQGWIQAGQTVWIDELHHWKEPENTETWGRGPLGWWQPSSTGGRSGCDSVTCLQQCLAWTEGFSPHGTQEKAAQAGSG